MHLAKEWETASLKTSHAMAGLGMHRSVRDDHCIKVEKESRPLHDRAEKTGSELEKLLKSHLKDVHRATDARASRLQTYLTHDFESRMNNITAVQTKVDQFEVRMRAEALRLAVQAEGEAKANADSALKALLTSASDWKKKTYENEAMFVEQTAFRIRKTIQPDLFKNLTTKETNLTMKVAQEDQKAAKSLARDLWTSLNQAVDAWQAAGKETEKAQKEDHKSEIVYESGYDHLRDDCGRFRNKAQHVSEGLLDTIDEHFSKVKDSLKSQMSGVLQEQLTESVAAHSTPSSASKIVSARPQFPAAESTGEGVTSRIFVAAGAGVVMTALVAMWHRMKQPSELQDPLLAC